MGIRLPKSILESMGIEEGDVLEVSLEDGKIILTRKKTVKFESLQHRLEFFYGTSLGEIQPQYTGEVEFGVPVGKELW